MAHVTSGLGFRDRNVLLNDEGFRVYSRFGVQGLGMGLYRDQGYYPVVENQILKKNVDNELEAAFYRSLYRILRGPE